MRLTSFKRPLHSFKDFFKEYLLVVLGVVTALAASAWITRVQHDQAAAAASAQMDQELQAVLDDIHSTLKSNRANARGLDRLGKLIADDLRQDIPAKIINEQIRAHRDEFQSEIYFPDTSTSAWDVAVANQSVDWIAPDRLQRYSKAYDDLRALGRWEQTGSYAGVNGPQISNLMTDLDQGRDVDPLAFLHAVEQVRIAMESTDGNIASVENDLVVVLHKDSTVAERH
ncbi:MAG TPA: hypothetical protein VFW60_09990 [Rhodanobacteraceae bacterium]|nr:hypothetical protein [Rhodanobacteraceae bacterium]